MSKDFFSSRMTQGEVLTPNHLNGGATSSSTSHASSPAARPPYRRHPTSLVKTIYMPNKTSMQVIGPQHGGHFLNSESSGVNSISTGGTGPNWLPPSYNELLIPSYRAQPALIDDGGVTHEIPPVTDNNLNGGGQSHPNRNSNSQNTGLLTTAASGGPRLLSNSHNASASMNANPAMMSHNLQHPSVLDSARLQYQTQHQFGGPGATGCVNGAAAAAYLMQNGGQSSPSTSDDSEDQQTINVTEMPNIDEVNQELVNGAHQDPSRLNFLEKRRLDSVYRQIYAGCASYVCLGVFSGFVAFLSLQLILSMTNYKSYHIQLEGTTKLLSELCTALSAAAFGLSLSGMMTAGIHVHMTLKAVKLAPVTEPERVLRYTQHGVYLRFVTACGSFIGVPLLLAATILFIFVHYGLVLRTVVGVLLGVAGFLCIFAILQTMYFWIFHGVRSYTRQDRFSKKHRDSSGDGNASSSKRASRKKNKNGLSLDAKLSTLV